MAHPRGVRPIALAILACVMSAAGVRTSSAEWRRIDSPNFVVIGDVSARTLRDVAIRFEGFRETLTRVFTERATATAVPTVVFVFPSDRAFTPFKKVYQGKPVSMSGLFVRRQDANYIAIVAGRETEGVRIVFHEYAHLVVSNLMRNVPAWLDEGLAEFYSTYDVSDGGRQAVLGAPIVHHLQELNDTRLLKLDELLNVDHGSPLYNEGSRRSVFYAQSWALTHLILLGERRRASELFAYLDRVSRGVTPKEAWQQAFGAADLERELKEYVGRHSYKAVQYKFPEKLATFEGVATPLPDADANAFLSEFLLQQGRPDEARERLSGAAKLDPANVRVKTVSALLDISRDDFDSASNRLLGIGAPADWLIAYGAAVGFVELLENRRETPNAQQMESARRLFEIVRQQRSEIPNATARLAILELRSPEGPSSATRTAIERARMLASGREDYAFVHAQILARLADFGAARQVVGPFMSIAYPPDVRQAARVLMGHIAELETAAQSRATRDALLAAASLPGAEASSAEPASAGSTTPSAAIAPVFRTLQAGEQRLDAVLERIECFAKGDAVFHILTVEGPARIGPQPMAKVDFITYRDDLAGNVRCGPVKPPLPVIVSWRAGTVPSAKIAVAVEFPPK